MNRVAEPIKERKKIDLLLKVLRASSERDYLICKFQLNTGLRISDVVTIKVEDIMNQNFCFKEYFRLYEKKTGKEKRIKLNDSLKSAVKSYVLNRKLNSNDHLFISRKKKDGRLSHITTIQAYRILVDAASQAGIENFSTHSLRKTWGYWSYKESSYNIGLLQDMFNHSSQKVTLRYIGINQEEKNRLYSAVQF